MSERATITGFADNTALLITTKKEDIPKVNANNVLVKIGRATEDKRLQLATEKTDGAILNRELNPNNNAIELLKEG